MMNEQVMTMVWLVCFNVRGATSACCFWAMVVMIIDLTEAETD